MGELSFMEVGWVFWVRPAGELFAGIAWVALRQDVARVVEMHDLFEALEVAIVHVSLHKAWRGAHVDIAQSGHLELGVELRSAFKPLSIRIELAAIALQRAEEGADSLIDVCRSREVGADIGSVAALVGLALVIELQSGISGNAEITGGKVRK